MSQSYKLGLSHFWSLELQPLDEYKELRSEISYESGLISQRIGWFITSQSFLFAALGVSSNRVAGSIETFRGGLLFPEIPIAAILLGLLVARVIAESYERAGRFRAKIDSLVGENANLRNLISSRSTTSVLVGRLSSLAIPTIFIVVWISILYTAYS